MDVRGIDSLHERSIVCLPDLYGVACEGKNVGGRVDWGGGTNENGVGGGNTHQCS